MLSLLLKQKVSLNSSHDSQEETDVCIVFCYLSLNVCIFLVTVSTRLLMYAGSGPEQKACTNMFRVVPPGFGAEERIIRHHEETPQRGDLSHNTNDCNEIKTILPIILRYLK